jgi:glycosyltransferase involved in cell wall biosynthesis
MIRVAFLIRSLNYGGAERQLVSMVKALDKDRFDVTVISFYSGGYFEKELEDSKIRLICLRKRARWDLLRFLWRLVGELKRLDPDILHSYLVEPNLLTVFLKPLFRSTKVVWAIGASNMDLKRYDWFVQLNFRLQRLASRYADLIISNSEAGRAYHAALGFPTQKFIVIPNGTDIDYFRPDPESRNRVRASWGIPDGAILIGVVARLDPMKDHPTFLKAASILYRRDSDLRFVCVGTGPPDYLASLRQLARDYGIADRVVWAGACDDMPAVYNSLDIACSSSAFGEGLPNVVCEAMACGLPCVVTDVGDSAWLVGETGIVVPPNDPQALAQGLAECLNMLASESRPNPRSRIEDRFTIGRLVSNTTAWLESLG